MSEPATDVGSSVESAYAWTRLCAALVLSAIGGVGMWSVIVALPAVQAEFGVARSAAALPYTMTMICFGFGGILMGRLSDRLGVMVPIVGGAISLGVGYVVASQASSLWQFALAQGLLVGVASSATTSARKWPTPVRAPIRSLRHSTERSRPTKPRPHRSLASNGSTSTGFSRTVRETSRRQLACWESIGDRCSVNWQNALCPAETTLVASLLHGLRS